MSLTNIVIKTQRYASKVGTRNVVISGGDHVKLKAGYLCLSFRLHLSTAVHVLILSNAIHFNLTLLQSYSSMNIICVTYT